MDKANKSGRLNRFFYGVGVFAFVVHFFNISVYAVNIPVEDEWGGASFYPKLQEPELHWKFIFHPHNTHLIAPSPPHLFHLSTRSWGSCGLLPRKRHASHNSIWS